LWPAETLLSKDAAAPWILAPRTKNAEVLFEKLTREWVDEQRISFGGAQR
jgi:hypothetical protein